MNKGPREAISAVVWGFMLACIGSAFLGATASLHIVIFVGAGIAFTVIAVAIIWIIVDLTTER